MIVPKLKLLHLFNAVISVTCPLVHLVRQEKTFLLVMTQGLNSYLHHL